MSLHSLFRFREDLIKVTSLATYGKILTFVAHSSGTRIAHSVMQGKSTPCRSRISLSQQLTGDPIICGLARAIDRFACYVLRIQLILCPTRISPKATKHKGDSEGNVDREKASKNGASASRVGRPFLFVRVAHQAMTLPTLDIWLSASWHGDTILQPEAYLWYRVV